jgi:hypothetical protein
MKAKVEVKDEAKNEPASEWLEPSPVGSEFMRHSLAMEQAARVPVHKAFAIAPGFNVGMLRKMAESYKPKRIVVIDHAENGFEVRRLGNNADVSLFYASLNPKAIEKLSNECGSIEDEQFSHLKRTIVEFLEMEEAQVIKYDAQGVRLREAACVGYAFLQRKCASISAFRKDEEGSTAGIKKALSQMEAEGLLRKLTSEEANELFNTNATIYRINKGAF